VPRPNASSPWARLETPVAGRALDPAGAELLSPGGTDPATTAVTYCTEPGSGSASVFSTARLGVGSVW
jgi:hypothetical protein